MTDLLWTLPNNIPIYPQNLLGDDYSHYILVGLYTLATYVWQNIFLVTEKMASVGSVLSCTVQYNYKTWAVIRHSWWIMSVVCLHIWDSCSFNSTYTLQLVCSVKKQFLSFLLVLVSCYWLLKHSEHSITNYTNCS